MTTRHRRPSLLSIYLCLCLGLCLGCFQRKVDLAWDPIKQDIRTSFPTVAHLSTQELADWLNDTARPAPLLLDVRSQEEFAVSHLPQARHIPPNSKLDALFPEVPRNSPIVTYCSVGHRSAELAARLQDAGYTQVLNLEGSIFTWANEGRPLVNAQGPTDDVHPYNATWGQLLKSHRP